MGVCLISRQCNLLTIEQDRTGRLLKYEPSTQQTTVLAQNVYYPNGVAVAKDSTFLLVSLTSKSRYFEQLHKCAMYSKILDEEKSKQAGLAQQNGFWPSIFVHDDDSGERHTNA